MNNTIPSSQSRISRRWSLRGLAALTEIELRALASEGKTLVSSLLLEPVVQLLFLAAGLQGLVGIGDHFYGSHSYLEFVLPGIIALQALKGFSRTTYRTVMDRQWGMLTIKRLAGTGGVGYALSKLVAPMIALVVQAMVLLILAASMGARFAVPNALAAIGFIAVALAFWVSLAIIVTAYVRDYVVRDMVVTWMMLPMSLAAPVFYQLESAPSYLQWIARFNPLSYQVQAVRSILLDGVLSGAVISTCVITIVAFTVALRSVSVGDALASEGGR